MFRNWIAKQPAFKLYAYALGLTIAGYILIPLLRILLRILLITHWPCSSMMCRGRGTMEISLYYTSIAVSLIGVAAIALVTVIAIRRGLKK